MENLGVRYHEAVDEIPYRTLLMMMQDKLRIATGRVVKETAGRTMAQRKMAEQKQ